MATIPAKMKALQVTAYNEPYKLTTVPVPTLGPHDLLVKIAVASYCHTDSMVASGVFNTALPVTGSHEGSGTVVAVGTQVTAFKRGDRVMCGIPLHPCGACADCVAPNQAHLQYCVHVAGHVGVHLDGCFAEYARVDARTSTHIPDKVGLLAAAPLACAGRTIWRGVRLADLEPGDWLAVIGSGGGLGHLGLQFAHHMHLRVVGVDARDEGLRLSARCGAELVVDARGGVESVVEEVQRVTGGLGAHAAIVLAAACTRMHGSVVQIAQPDTGVRVPFRELVFRDIRFRGSMLCSPRESSDMLDFVARLGGGFFVETVAFEGLERIGEVMDLVRGGGLMGKAVVVVDPEQLEDEKRLGRGE
ncbi:GroES-like protein [Hypoxylon sp. NC1633]|nr:GroES-like protein [Hypoxylon sp. NC1633]